jgi:hypothetical protein
LREPNSRTGPPGQQSDRDFAASYFSELEKLTAEGWLRS